MQIKFFDTCWDFFRESFFFFKLINFLIFCIKIYCFFNLLRHQKKIKRQKLFSFLKAIN